MERCSSERALVVGRLEKLGKQKEKVLWEDRSAYDFMSNMFRLFGEPMGKGILKTLCKRFQR